jgi:hypothetical protein
VVVLWRSVVLCVAVGLATGASAQQRPLETEDPQTIGAGRLLIEGGISYAQKEFYPLSGLEGNLWQTPVLGLIVGLSPIADFELTGGPYDRLEITDRRPAPLAGVVSAAGETTHSVDDLVIGAKIRLVPEAAYRPAIGFRFAVRLPNAKHASGLGQDTTDFSASLLAGKTIGAVRLAGNGGFTIMSEPLNAAKQNDVVTYGVSLAYRVNRPAEVVAEINGRWSTRDGVAPVGTESRSTARVGARYRIRGVQLDAAAFFGLTPIDATFGVTAGVSYVFKAFTLPAEDDRQ